MTEYKLVGRFERGDGSAAVEILKGDQGLFRFDVLAWRGPWEEFGVKHEGYWSPTHQSGYYDSASAAELDARGQVVWLATAGMED